MNLNDYLAARFIYLLGGAGFLFLLMLAILIFCTMAWGLFGFIISALVIWFIVWSTINFVAAWITKNARFVNDNYKNEK